MSHERTSKVLELPGPLSGLTFKDDLYCAGHRAFYVGSDDINNSNFENTTQKGIF